MSYSSVLIGDAKWRIFQQRAREQGFGRIAALIVDEWCFADAGTNDRITVAAAYAPRRIQARQHEAPFGRARLPIGNATGIGATYSGLQSG